MTEPSPKLRCLLSCLILQSSLIVCPNAIAAESGGVARSGAVGHSTTAPSTRPSLPVADADAQVQHPLEVRSDRRAAVLIFIGVDCPISNSYAQEFARLCLNYRAKGFEFSFVYTAPDTTAAAAREHARKFGLDGVLLLDPDHALARQVQATVTPEAVVIGLDSEILYRGRIDDLYYDLGKRRFEATHHELRDALDAIIEGNAVPCPRTSSIGCAIGD